MRPLYKPKHGFRAALAEGYAKSYSDYLCEEGLGINLDEQLAEPFDYPDVTDRVTYPDGTLKGGMYKGLRVMVSRKDNLKAPRTQTIFCGGKPALIHINGKQAINPAFSWYHEIAHVEEPGGQSPDPTEAEFVADRHAIRKLGMTRDQYKQWLISRDSSGDSPAHIEARTKLCNNFSRYLEEAEGKPVTLAGALCEDFRRVRRALAEVYDVDESASLETALWGGVDEDCEVYEGRVDEISLRRLIDATGISLARNTSAHQSDQAVAFQYVRNHHADDPDLDKEIRDIKDQTKVNNLKMRLGATQKQYKQAVISANDKDRLELKQRLPRIRSISQSMRDAADEFVKKHKQHIKAHPTTGLKVSPEARDDYEQMLRKSRGYGSRLEGSAISTTPKYAHRSSAPRQKYN